MRPKSEFYTLKRDDEHPTPFHMRSPTHGGFIWPSSGGLLIVTSQHLKMVQSLTLIQALKLLLGQRLRWSQTGLSSFLGRSHVNAWKKMYGDRYELLPVWVRPVPVSCKSVPPIVLLVRKSTFDLWFSFFSLKIDFKHWIFILRFDFWCMATVGRRSWQVVSEAKTPWALPWKNWNCRE